MAARGCGTLFCTCLSQRVLHTYLANILRQEVPKRSCSVPAKFQTHARHPPEPLNHLGTGPSASQRRRHLQQPSKERWRRGNCCSHCQGQHPRHLKRGGPWLDHHWKTVGGGAHKKNNPKHTPACQERNRGQRLFQLSSCGICILYLIPHLTARWKHHVSKTTPLSQTC